MSIYETGTGFMPPLIRAYGGLLALLMVSELGDEQPSSDEIKANLRAANESFAGLIKPAALPDELWNQLTDWRNHLGLASAAGDTDLQTVRNLMQDVWIFSSRLDYELLGHENSLAGTTP
jgi:uncharacterized protein YmfQ (DUF2313 family)